MKIGIHHREGSYSTEWISYCDQNDIAYKLVDCYKNDIIEQLADCDALMWHYYHESAKDIQFAKQLLFALEGSGKVVYPNRASNWHFDDKVGQKYLFESIGAPLVPSYAFYTKREALEWVNSTSFPKVFKLRGGAGSSNVRLVRSRAQAVSFVRKAFGRGFKRYHPLKNLNERWRLYKMGKMSFVDLLKGWIRLLRPTKFARVMGRDRGYIYFQDFIPNNTHDIRVTYVNNRCFASRRAVRPGDFRASGSGIPDMDQANVPLSALEISFDVAEKLGLQSAAIDFVVLDDKPLIVEICYAYGHYDGHYKHGYYDRDLNYYKEEFNAYHWMVDWVLEEVQNGKN